MLKYESRIVNANNTISAFTSKHSPGGATMRIRIENTSVKLTTHLSIDPKKMSGRVGHVG